jgi:type I restriction enzyme R subunit
MKIEWEYDLCEKPFCEQLKLMGWQWLEGDTDVPYLTERENFREVLLKDRLEAALRKLNLRDGKPWLDDARIARAIRDLDSGGGPPADGDQSACNEAVAERGIYCRVGPRQRLDFSVR